LSDDTAAVRVLLPYHLRNLAQVDGAVTLSVGTPVTQRAVFDALERRYPALCGTIRDRSTGRRRAFVRLFACEQDLSHDSPDDPLPDSVAAGREPLLVVGAMAGG
jgi:sulfur-carrier protein